MRLVVADTKEGWNAKDNTLVEVLRDLCFHLARTKVLIHPRTDVPLPSALFAPLNVQGRNNSCSPQCGEWTGR